MCTGDQLRYFFASSDYLNVGENSPEHIYTAFRSPVDQSFQNTETSKRRPGIPDLVAMISAVFTRGRVTFTCFLLLMFLKIFFDRLISSSRYLICTEAHIKNSVLLYFLVKIKY